MTIWIKYEVFSYINQFHIQKCFSTVSRVRVAKKNAKKNPYNIFSMYFMKKLNEIVNIYLETKISSKYTNILL